MKKANRIKNAIGFVKLDTLLNLEMFKIIYTNSSKTIMD